MVSQRCKMMVKAELLKLGLHTVEVTLGMVEILEDIAPEQRALLKLNLKKSGLELLDDKRSVLVEKVKTVIVDLIQLSNGEVRSNYSDILSEKIGYEYAYLSNVFSEVNGITIQQFIILSKIERIKELLIYDRLSLSEISYLMNYSSVAHLSSQFKKITGLTPTYFKILAKNRRLIINSDLS